MSSYDGGDDAIDALAYALASTYGEQIQAIFQRFRRHMSQSAAETWYMDEIMAHPETYDLGISKEAYIYWFDHGMWDQQTRKFTSAAARERGQRSLAETCQEDVDALKIAHPGEVTPEIELRMLALGEINTPQDWMSPRDWLEHLFELARNMNPRPGIVRAPETAPQVTSTTSPFPLRYYDDWERWDAPGRRQDVANDATETRRNTWMRGVMPSALDASSPSATAREDPAPPKPVEFRVSPPTTKRRITIKDEE